MTRGPRHHAPRFRVVHRLPGRMRLRGFYLADPGLDLEYLKALVCAQPGVLSARVNAKANSLVVKHRGEPGLEERILDLLRDLPPVVYSADPPRHSAPDRAEVAARAVLAGVTPLIPPPFKALLSWGLALPTLAKGAETLLTAGLKVEVLDAGAKAFSLLRGDYLTANVIGALLALAGHVEDAAQQKTNDLLAGLLRPQVDMVRVRRNGLDEHIPFDQARVGDLVLCQSGEMVPVDGRVVEGEALVNASSITGESVPVHLAPGQEVLSGGVVEEGALVIEASGVGADTSTARIAGYIEKSLRNKSSGQERSEQLADRLVPLTFGVGLGIFALTGNLASAASVLTVDYSCAVKLSAPVAVRAAMYSAGQKGVLVKGAQALESLAKVDTVVFDKTGTLTRGALMVTDVVPLNGSDPLNSHGQDPEDGLLALAAGAERHYNHPVASAVVRAAREQGLAHPDMSQVDFVVAHGVSAYVDGERVLVGSRHFIHDDEGIDCALADARAATLQDAGKSLLYVARDGRLLGLIAMRDDVRPESAETLRLLKQSGIQRLILLSGDQERAVDALRTALPELDEVHAELKPEDKAAMVESLVAQGRCVAFVGDGVNDAPALMAADVGVSMPSGADLARDVARILLLKDDLGGLVTARTLALRTQAVLKQCLWGSVGLNSALLALAGAGLLPAVASASIHNGGTIAALAYAALRSSAALPNTTSPRGIEHVPALPSAV